MDNRYQIREYDYIDSTNNEAKRIINQEKINSPLLLIAKGQSMGRGRLGRSFYSPSGTGLYMTLVIPMGCPISGQVTITAKAAVAVNKALESLTGKHFGIKWVNDIYYHDRKCCGILCEAVNDYDKMLLDYAVIGVGVNIFTSEWIPELENTATSVFESLKACADISRESAEISQSRIIEPFIFRLACSISDNLLEELNSQDFIEYYKKHSIVLGRSVEFIKEGTAVGGQAADIDENGGLVIKLQDGSQVILNSGEISLRLK